MMNNKNEKGEVRVRFVRGPANGKRIYLPIGKINIGYEHSVYIQFNHAGKRVGLDLELPRRAMIDGVAYRLEVKYHVRGVLVPTPSGTSRLYYLSPWFSTEIEDIISRFAA
jgi:hypothetical protein